MRERKKMSKYFWLIYVIFGLIVVGIIYVAYTTANASISLRNEQVTKELGEPVRLEPADYLSIQTLNMDNIIIKSPLTKDKQNYQYNPETKEITSKSKGYLNKGVYYLTFAREKNAGNLQTLELTVKDTIAPDFTQFPQNSLLVVEQYANIHFERYFSILDMDTDSHFSIMAGQVNLLEQGIYPAKIIATDTSGNKVEKRFNVKVVSEKEAESNPSILTRTTDGRLELSKGTQMRVSRGQANKELGQTLELPEHKSVGSGSVVNTEQELAKKINNIKTPLEHIRVDK